MFADDRPLDSEEPAVISIPHQSLSADALKALIEEFVTRHGTDYGLHEKSLQDKVDDVMRRLESGEASVVFDPKTETANIVMSDSII